MNRAIERSTTLAIAALFLALPAWIFVDALSTYRLHSDDFEYVARSRTFDEAVANLFLPHNTHIVPAWRLLNWGVVRLAGRLANLQITLAAVAYLALVVAMLLTGRIAARETGRQSIGLLAMLLLGTTSVMQSSATWYSSGQTLWAAIGLLAMLANLQAWRSRGGGWRLALAAALAWLAGGFWTIGHAAGPVGAMYLALGTTGRRRWAAAVPLLATTASVLIALWLGGRQIDAKISFHGRTESEAIDPVAGLTHTLQAIPEDLLFENLGLEVETTIAQGAMLTVLILTAWGMGVARQGRPSPLEGAGLLLIASGYLVEWTFRGYLPFSSLRGIVPWYDTIPHVGAVLLLVGWVGRVAGMPSGLERLPTSRPVPTRRIEAVAMLGLAIMLAGLHAPRAADLFAKTVPAKSTEPIHRLLFTPTLRRAAAQSLAAEFARRQRLDLAKLDRAEAVARSLGIGHDAIAESFGRVEILEIPDVYDADGMLDLPDRGTLHDPVRVRQALGELLTPSPAPVMGFDIDKDEFILIR